MNSHSPLSTVTALCSAAALALALASCSVSSDGGNAGDTITTPTTNAGVNHASRWDTSTTATTYATAHPTPPRGTHQSEPTTSAPDTDNSGNTDRSDIPEGTVKAVPRDGVMLVDNTFGWAVVTHTSPDEYTVLLPSFINSAPTVGQTIAITSSQRSVRGLVGTITKVAKSDTGYYVAVTPAPIRAAYDTLTINTTLDLSDAVTIPNDPMGVDGVIAGSTRLGKTTISELPWQCYANNTWVSVRNHLVDFKPTVTITGKLGRDAFDTGTASLAVTTHVTTTVHGTKNNTELNCRLDPEGMKDHPLWISVPGTPLSFRLGLRDEITWKTTTGDAIELSAALTNRTSFTQRGDTLVANKPHLVPVEGQPESTTNGVVHQTLELGTTLNPTNNVTGRTHTWNTAEEAKAVVKEALRQWGQEKYDVAPKDAGLSIAIANNTTMDSTGGQTTTTGTMTQSATANQLLLGDSTPETIDLGTTKQSVTSDGSSSTPADTRSDTDPECGPHSQPLTDVTALPAVNSSDYVTADSTQFPDFKQVWFVNEARTTVCTFDKKDVACGFRSIQKDYRPHFTLSYKPHDEDVKPDRVVPGAGPGIKYFKFYVGDGFADLGTYAGDVPDELSCPRLFSNNDGGYNYNYTHNSIPEVDCEYRLRNVKVLPRGTHIDLGDVVCANAGDGITCLSKDDGVGIEWHPNDYKMICRKHNSAYSYNGKSTDWKRWEEASRTGGTPS